MIRPITSFIILSFLLPVFLVAGCGVNSDLVEEYNNFGVKSAKMGLWDEAIMRWKHIVEMEPNNAKAHNNLGVAYESTGKLEAAMKEYETAIELDSENKIYTKNYKKFKQNYERTNKKNKTQNSADKTQDTRL